MPGPSTAHRTTGSRRSIPAPARAPESHTRPTPHTHDKPHPGTDGAGDVVRWAAFSCVLVPLVLVGYGISAAGAAGAALGLAAVTAACRLLLRQSERHAVRLHTEQCCTHRGRHGRTGQGAHRGGHRAGQSAPVD
ncbi:MULTISPECIES: hypothetical protein [unclassified Streptomyces]|uniref:hypothetical protein n=1 Tax=Streptomyces sp. SID8367 TaxID=2690349 RepID=UPI000DC3DA64|nr:hypothetical protein [Streptomyces sp. PsTaAH-137]RAJ82922.1 hypothetical protein K377_03973 [Streptomyces sp. PsTaAH-137]